MSGPASIPHPATPSQGSLAGPPLELPPVAGGRRIIPLGARRPLAIGIEALLFLAAWEAITTWSGLVNPLFLPAPSSIVGALAGLVMDGRLIAGFGVTLGTWAFSFIVSSVLGVTVGLLMGTFEPVRQLVSPIAWSLYATPSIALRPLFVVWLGFGFAPNAALVIFTAVWPILLTTAGGASTIDPVLIRAGRVYGASRLALHRTILIPATLPFIVTGMRLAIPASLIVLVVTEILGGTEGLGGLISLATAQFRVAEAFATLVALVATAMLLLSVFGAAERRLAPWRIDREGR